MKVIRTVHVCQHLVDIEDCFHKLEKENEKGFIYEQARSMKPYEDKLILQ